MKFLTLLLLSFGEVMTIYAEELGAKSYNASHEFFHTFLSTLPLLIIGALSLVCAYIFGFRYFQNIWTLSAVSFGTILVIEPLFDFFYIGNTPTLGAGIGFLFGVAGILATLLIS